MHERAVSVVLVEDHKIVRQGIRSLLELDPSFKVLGEAASGSEGLDLVKSVKPDVVITDLVMSGMNGIEFTKKVKEVCPATQVIVLSMYNNSGYVYEALRSGASGYVLKGSGIDDLTQAITAVVSGRRYLSPPLSEEEVEKYGQKTNASADT